MVNRNFLTEEQNLEVQRALDSFRRDFPRFCRDISLTPHQMRSIDPATIVALTIMWSYRALEGRLARIEDALLLGRKTE